jgi:two-component system, OmpR family, response regulator ResD
VDGGVDGGDDAVRGARPEDGPILVVDDDPEDRLLVRTILKKHGWQVEEAVDGEEALSRIASDTAYALVVLDLVMPNIDGRDVLSRVRSAGSTVPIIVMTGSSDPEDEPLLIESGADDYLRKPLDPRRFVARVRAALRRARMA